MLRILGTGIDFVNEVRLVLISSSVKLELLCLDLSPVLIPSKGPALGSIEEAK